MHQTSSMNDTQALLIELLTEELPPKALKALGASFSGTIFAGLQAKGLLAQAQPDSFESFASPRRLAVLVPGVASTGQDHKIELKGPSTKVGLDADGLPTMALIKWAEKQGAKVEQLTQGHDGKQDCFYFQTQVAGSILQDEISGIVQNAVNKLPVPKVMQYQLADGLTSVSFVRPAHRLTVLHGTTVLPAALLGLKSDRLTEGHRFHSESSIPLASAQSYESTLENVGKVIASYEKRRATIAKALIEAAQKESAQLSHVPGLTDANALDGELAAYLDEVTALVEWPRVYEVGFEERFLKVPQECLILTMRTNQKYFPLFDVRGKLLPKFLVVSNMDLADPKNIVTGNQRVVRPRLADAEFFYHQDQRASLASRVPQLAQVVYHAKLGSQLERTQRVSALAQYIATALGSDGLEAGRAAQLSKADLLTDMVGEFPELQGIMGEYYAKHDGESDIVAQAIAQHYQPRFAGDALPAFPIAIAVALSDKLETLAGIWGIGQQPTGDKDPFALRRHALGVVRMLIEDKSAQKPEGLDLSLNTLLAKAFDGLSHLPAMKADVIGLRSFILDRLRGYLREKGFAPSHIEACLATESPSAVESEGFKLNHLRQRLAAVQAFALLPEAQALAAANKRIGNILRKNPVPACVQLAVEKLVEPAEKALLEAMQVVEPRAKLLYDQGAYEGALKSLAILRSPVDTFFDQMMVMVEDEAVRNNRLALLTQLHGMMNRVADLSALSA